MRSIKAKLVLLGLLSVLGTLVVTAGLLIVSKQQLFEGRELKTRHLVEVATGLADHYFRMSQAGQLSEAEAKRQAIAAIKALRYEEKEYFWINDMKPVMVMHPFKPELDGKDLADFKDPDGKLLFVEFVNMVKAHGAGMVAYKWPKPGASAPVQKISYVKGFAPWGWVIGSGIYTDDVNTVFLNELLVSGGVVLVGLLLLGGFGWVTIRSIVQPLSQMVSQAKRAVEQNDFTVRVAAGSGDEIAVAADAFNDLLGKLRSVTMESKEASDAFMRASSTLSGSSRQLSAGAHEQSSAASSVAASIEEISVAISETAEHARDVEATVDTARQESERAIAITQKTMANIDHVAASIRTSSDNVQELLERSKQISGIVNVIKEIADQTNLLALNAAIEAARAGEQGRGFAVVADEVRKLAERTTVSTQEISGLIGTIQSQISDTVQSMHSADEDVAASVAMASEAGEILQRAMESSIHINERVSDITHSVREQDAAVRSVAQSIEKIAGMAEQSSTAASGNNEIAQQMESQAANLQRLISKYRVA
ncbi:MAG TPA: methyl-accepting chemotaxis protein [Rhodocyclaceae bacterium]|nr:methyl-accepting chemotaxis protein [Rhodocyclaceae bacterium]